MLWSKPKDQNERIANMKDERGHVLVLARRMADEITYEKRGKAVFWKAAFEDTGGSYNIYECRQDALTPDWLIKMGLCEHMEWAKNIRDQSHTAALDHFENTIGMIR